MVEIKGKYSKATIFADIVEDEALKQVLELCNQTITQKAQIRIMPDVHAGKGCVIGFTSTEMAGVIPNLIGVDIGCGMYVVKLGKVDISFDKLDMIIRRHIPSGFEVNKTERTLKSLTLSSLHCIYELKNVSRLDRSLGTLGGGNHFIEVAEDSRGNKYLIIHSGSRNLGKQVADYYQKMAEDIEQNHIKSTIQNLKMQNRGREIEGFVKSIKEVFKGTPKELRYLVEDTAEKYIHDMEICVIWARFNREIIANTIMEHMGLQGIGAFHTTHNYIEVSTRITRKGAVRANAGEELLIPMNMRDGSLLCVGKGNPEWNYSAPHGAGRLMSRKKAKETFTLDEFTRTMKGIYSSSVRTSTIDESPMVYKPMEEIVDKIGETVEIKEILRPLYNFKSS